MARLKMLSNSRVRGKARSQEGAAAVEFAIVLPLLLVLVFGIVEFGIILFDQAMITNASREGARAGIVYRGPSSFVSEAEIQGVVDNYCRGHLISLKTGSSPGTTVAGAGGVSGAPLTVRVSYRYNFLVLPAFASGLVWGIDLRAASVMRME